MSTSEDFGAGGKLGWQRVRALPTAFYSLLASKDRGATATEYALLVAFVALAIVAGVAAFGQSLAGYYDSITQGLADALP